MANSTIESALYTLVKCGENLILAINSVLWVCAHKGVFYIQKNFSKNFSIHPNISPVSFGRYTGTRMGQPSSKDEMTIRHQFDRLCQMALKGEAVNYYKHMDYRRKHEVTFSELSEKELSKLFTMDEYGTEYHHFEVHGYDIEVKNTLIAEALKELTERKRNVILLSYFMEMSDADIAREMNLVRSTIHEHRTRSLEILKKIMEGIADEKDV